MPTFDVGGVPVHAAVAGDGAPVMLVHSGGYDGSQWTPMHRTHGIGVTLIRVHLEVHPARLVHLGRLHAQGVRHARGRNGPRLNALDVLQPRQCLCFHGRSLRGPRWHPQFSCVTALYPMWLCDATLFR